jgi:phage terminase small subunit
MARTATKKQRGFAKDYVETGNATQAALKNYNTEDYMTAANIGSENLNKPKVRDLIDGFAAQATINIQELANNAENEAVRLKANIDQADRAGYKAIERSLNVNVEVDMPELKELTEKLNEYYRGTEA